MYYLDIIQQAFSGSCQAVKQSTQKVEILTKKGQLLFSKVTKFQNEMSILIESNRRISNRRAIMPPPPSSLRRIWVKPNSRKYIKIKVKVFPLHLPAKIRVTSGVDIIASRFVMLYIIRMSFLSFQTILMSSDHFHNCAILKSGLQYAPHM